MSSPRGILEDALPRLFAVFTSKRRFIYNFKNVVWFLNSTPFPRFQIRSCVDKRNVKRRVHNVTFSCALWKVVLLFRETLVIIVYFECPLDYHEAWRCFYDSGTGGTSSESMIFYSFACNYKTRPTFLA